MSLSKAVIMGKVVRNPEKRFTTNNVPITTFAIDISNNDSPSIIKIVAKGKLAETSAEKVLKDKVVIVEGRLQTNAYKTSAGQEKKSVEIDAQAIELVGESQATSKSYDNAEELFDFDTEVSSDDLIGEDEIPF